MTTEQTTPIASARGLVKTYGTGDTAVHALAGVDVDFGRGQMTAIMGPSGSGKSTLMHCMAGLDRTDAGIGRRRRARRSARMNERRLTKLRRDRLGFVFQAFNLVPTLTALENITLPLDIARRPVDKAHLDAVVQAVGLAGPPQPQARGAVRRAAAARRVRARAGDPARGRVRRRADGQPRLDVRRRRCWASCAGPSTSSASRSSW